MASTILRLLRFFIAMLVWYVEDVQSCATMNSATGNGQIGGGSKVELADYSFDRSMTIKDPWGKKVGSISASLWSYNVNLILYNAAGQTVAHLENPGVFWDASSTMYDCNHNRILEIKWPPANLLLHPQQKEYKIVLHDKHVADLHVKRLTTPASKDIYLVKVGGIDVLEFSAEFKSSFEKGFGWFGRYKSVSFQVLTTATPLVPLDPMLDDARFVYLVSAFLLAPNGNGPIWFALPFLLPCLVCCALFCVGYGANLCNAFCHWCCHREPGQRQTDNFGFGARHKDMQAGHLTQKQLIEDQQRRNAHLEQLKKQKGVLAWFPCCSEKKQVHPAETRHLLPPQGYTQSHHGQQSHMGWPR